jgi:hypothetical protein
MKNKTITVKGIEISIIKQNDTDYISLTDMLKAKDGDFFIADWLRNRNTVEFLGIWESVYNSDFNYGEFAIIKSQAGLNNYKISVKEWEEKTNAIGLKATAGRYGGTYAHPDIADMLMDEERETLDSIEQRIQKKIVIKSDTSYHIEQCEVFGSR